MSSKLECSDSENYETSTIEFASKPPPNTFLCYWINHVEILQTLGNYTFSVHFGTDEFIQKKIDLIEKTDSTKLSRLPAPSREKCKCFSLDKHDSFFFGRKNSSAQIVTTHYLSKPPLRTPRPRDKMLPTPSRGDCQIVPYMSHVPLPVRT